MATYQRPGWLTQHIANPLVAFVTGRLGRSLRGSRVLAVRGRRSGSVAVGSRQPARSRRQALSRRAARRNGMGPQSPGGPRRRTSARPRRRAVPRHGSGRRRQAADLVRLSRPLAKRDGRVFPRYRQSVRRRPRPHRAEPSRLPDSAGVSVEQRFCARESPATAPWVQPDQTFGPTQPDILPAAQSLGDDPSGALACRIRP
jgi:hypothetical protein